MADIIIHPTEDPGCTLTGLVATPSDTVAFPGLRPAVLIIHGGGFEHKPSSPQTNQCWQEMASIGYLSVLIDYRLGLPPSGDSEQPPGQTTSGHFPQQYDDILQWVSTVRKDSRCNGLVYAIGGSAGATHVVNACGTGVYGDSRLDGGVAISGAYAFGDQTSRTSNPSFDGFVTRYAETTDNDTLNARSPIGRIDANNTPIQFWQGDNEAMPAPQMGLMTDKLLSLGRINFESVLLTGTGGTVHSFANWPTIHFDAARFLNSLVAGGNGIGDGGGGTVTGGGGGSGGTAGTLNNYTWTLSGPGTAMSGTTSGVIAGDAVKAQISGLTPGTPYTFTLRANNALGASPPAVATFTSDAAIQGGGGGTTGRKFVPKGVYGYLTDPNSFLTDGLWADGYVDGARLDIGWKVIQPISATNYNWTAPDAFLAKATASKKKAAICIVAGTSSPDWVIAEGAKIFTGSAGTFPVPWDPIFLNEWKAFIQAFAARYESSSALTYVGITGLGRTDTTLITGLTSERDGLQAIAQAASFDTLQSALQSSSSDICAQYLSSFTTTPLVINLETPFPDGNGNTASLYLSNLITSAYGDHRIKPPRLLGLMVNDLTASSSAAPSVADAAFQTKVGLDSRPYGARFKYNSDNPLLDPTQTGSYNAETGLINAGDAGVALGAQFIELFTSDLAKADPFPGDIADLGGKLKVK